MARAPRIQIEGLRETRRALKAISADAAKDMRPAHLEAAEIVARQSKFEVPVRSGALRNSIRAAATQTRGQVRVGSVGVPYAGPIHFGWPTRPRPSKGWYGGPIEAQPFIYEAADRRVDEVLDAYDARLAALSRRYGLDD